MAPRPTSLLVLLAAPLCCHADLRVVPGITAGLTYTDNVALAPAGAQQGRLVMSLGPSLGIYLDSLRFDASLQVRRDEFRYAGDAAPARRQVTTVAARAGAELVPDWLYVDGSASVRQQPVSAFGAGAVAAPYASAERSEVRSWRWAPVLEHSFGAVGHVRLEAAHDEVRAAVAGFGASRQNSAALQASGSTGIRRLHWSAAARRSRQTDTQTGTSDTRHSDVGLRWLLGPAWAIGAGVGSDHYDFGAGAGAVNGRSRALSLDWAPDARTSLRATVGHRFFGRADSLSVRLRSRRLVWNLDYAADVTSLRTQFVLPATLDTADLVDRLLRPLYPDARTRAAAVRDYMQRSGLPPSLADSVRYLSNRFTVQRQWQAGVAVRGARTQVVVGVYDARRRALTGYQADSALLGTALAQAHDATRQRGLQAQLTGVLDRHSQWTLAADVYRARSLTDGRSTSTRMLRLGVTHRFGQNLQGAFELRHTRGARTGAQGFREHAVAFTLQAHF